MGQLDAFYSCIPTGVRGPTYIFWADLKPFSLQDVSLRREGKKPAHRGTLEERGEVDFKSIDWIRCARWYEEWGGDKVLQSAAERHTTHTSVLSGRAAEEDSRAVRRQKRAFEDLAPLVDFLQARRTPPGWPRTWASFSPSIAASPQECTGQLPSFGPT